MNRNQNAYVRTTYIIDQGSTFALLYSQYGSMQKLADDLGFSGRTVRNYMKPGKVVQRKTVKRLSEAFGVPVDHFARPVEEVG